jgi:quinol monooxygenase YgiN
LSGGSCSELTGMARCALPPAYSWLAVETHLRQVMSERFVTLINVFTVGSERQPELIALLAGATEESVRRAPGFMSARLHRSLDGTKVTMYTQWRGNEDYQATRQDSAYSPFFFKRALEIATFELGMYEVVQSFSPIGPDA